MLFACIRVAGGPTALAMLNRTCLWPQVGAFTIGYLREVEASMGGGSAAADKDAAEPEAPEETAEVVREAEAAHIPKEAVEFVLPAKTVETAAVVKAAGKKAPNEEQPVSLLHRLGSLHAHLQGT